MNENLSLTLAVARQTLHYRVDSRDHPKSTRSFRKLYSFVRMFTAWNIFRTQIQIEILMIFVIKVHIGV